MNFPLSVRRVLTRLDSRALQTSTRGIATVPPYGTLDPDTMSGSIHVNYTT